MIGPELVLSRRAFVGLSLSIAATRPARAQDAAPTRAVGGPEARTSVRAALAEQADLIEKKEHCSADRRVLAAIGGDLGHQVRVARNAEEFAIFTVSAVRDDVKGQGVRMGRSGRSRLGITAEFAATIGARIAHPTLTDAEAEAAGEFVERLDQDGDRTWLAILAPHGGGIEPRTDEQAERLAARFRGKGVASWRCKGWHPKGTGAAFERWHITSTETHEASFPLLAKLGHRRFDHCVSFHGMGDPGVLIGGGGPPALKEAIRAELARVLAGSRIEVKVAGEGQALGGSSPRNIVNRVCKGAGIQVEQSAIARRGHWREIADAVGNVYETRP